MQAEVWREVSTYSRPEPALGRCHGMCLLGRKMVFFGGTCDASNRVTMLDLHTNKWHSPKVLGRTIGRCPWRAAPGRVAVGVSYPRLAVARGGVDAVPLVRGLGPGFTI